MKRLADGTLPSLAKGVRQPSYDRSRTRIGFAHIGVGAFHRGHQAEYTEDALEAGADDRAEIGINLRPPSIEDQLSPQDGLYTRLLVGGDRTEARVIGSIRKVLDAARGHAEAIAALSHPGIDVITMTVTEKGYCHVPATGALDWQRPEIKADLQQATGRQSLPGFLTEMLARRMAANAPLTLVSCDNIPGNGAILKAVVSDLAEAVDRPLAAWIADNVRFPSTMVDRIVPATQAEDLKRVEELTGVVDKSVVVGEPFRQWVLEDDFNRRRPRWDIAGAEFVRDVQPYEFIKMRVLNACQTALSYLGALSGLETSYDAVCDPLLRSFAEHMISDESSAVLPDVPGMQVAPYLKLSLSRLSNPAIRHTNHQIATDGSQKINQRLLQPLRDRMAQGLPSPLLETAVGGWVTYLAKSQPAFGAAWQANDQIMPFVADTARASAGDIEAFAKLFVGNRSIFGETLAGDASFASRVASSARALMKDGVAKALGRTMAQPVAAG
ncbi:mannitol dehydrogenase family protein [Mesorhizobium sp. VNQ89]|uniref:mannitol dehydrogenase family protein n=1 Tax=Mesorhizobium quangtriensis TaxID=3157709 RepID=UPI0032B70F0D